MTDSLHVQPPRPFGPVASPFMDDLGPDPEPYLESELLTAKEPDSYGRKVYVSVNLILLVLVPILLILGWQALHEVKAEREDKVHAEYCQFFEDSAFPMPDDCP